MVRDEDFLSGEDEDGEGEGNERQKCGGNGQGDGSEGNGNREKKQREGGVRQTGQNEQKGGNLNFMRDTQTFSFSYK